MKRKLVIILSVVGLLAIAVYFAGGTSTFSWIADSFSSHPMYPKYDSLKAHGFYAFVLPQSEIQQRKWAQTISIYSWTMHCGLLTGDTYNPLQVWYTDDAEKRVFEIQLGPWGMIWDHRRPTVKTEVELESKWSAGTLMYYTQATSEGLPNRLYRFSDLWGHDVEIQSNLSVTETIGLIEQFEYIGPPLEEVNDPWDCE